MLPVSNWPTVRSVDFGFHHPACVWVQTSPSGQPYVVHEFVPAFGERSAGLRTSDFAAAILAEEAPWKLATPPSRTFGDPAGKGVDPQTGHSEVDVFQRAGMAFSAQTSSVRDGCVKLLDLLANPTAAHDQQSLCAPAGCHRVGATRSAATRTSTRSRAIALTSTCSMH